MHDSRLDPGFAIAYQCEPTPGRHSISSYMYTDLYGVKKTFPRAKQMIARARGKTSQKIQGYTAGSFYAQLVNSTGMCFFGAITSTLPLVDWINAVTGWDLSADEYFQTGERILSLRKAFNVREGIKPNDHKLSDRALGKAPLQEGPLKGVAVDMEPLKREFFDIVGWDPVTGGPTAEKMKALGIDSLCE